MKIFKKWLANILKEELAEYIPVKEIIYRNVEVLEIKASVKVADSDAEFCNPDSLKMMVDTQIEENLLKSLRQHIEINTSKDLLNRTTTYNTKLFIIKQ